MVEFQQEALLENYNHSDFKEALIFGELCYWKKK
jgi:hypothetical protein